MATFKNRFLSGVCFLLAGLSPLMAQQRACATPDFISANAHTVIDSYRDLIDQRGTITCVYDPTIRYYCVSSAMAANGYNLGCYDVSCSRQVYGAVTFVSSYFFDHYDAPSRAYFRTMWAEKGIYPALVCPDAIPETVLYPFDHNSTQNHVFQSIMVPVGAYQAFADPQKRLAIGYPALTALAVKPEDIKSINDVYLECPTGYIKRTEGTNYADVHSSKGIICDILLKSGQNIQCYLINNYDGAGTLLWKKHRRTTLASTATQPSTLAKTQTEGSIEIAPNPVKDFLTIQNATNKTVEVVNLVGQVVLRQEKLASDRLDVQSLPVGTYLITVSEDGKRIGQQKIVKKD
jgi:Secretion system C-terminal sorting domain